MMRINRGAEVRPGVFSYDAVGLPISGRSRQPLLDACRQIIALIGPTEDRAGIFREGRTEPDMTCPIAKGAEVTVSEPDKGRVRFVRYQPFGLKLDEAAR